MKIPFHQKLRLWFRSYFSGSISADLRQAHVITPIGGMVFLDGGKALHFYGKSYGYAAFCCPVWKVDWDGGPLFKYAINKIKPIR